MTATALAIPLPETARSRVKRIPLNLLFVDPDYQRDLGLNKVRDIQRAFDPLAAGLLLVSARPDGRYAVIDGQHRLAAMRGAGVTHALCQVAYNLTPQQEADIFIRCNTVRRPPRALDVFRARLHADDPEARELNAIVESFGYHIALNRTRPGKNGFVCVGALDHVYRRHGADGLRRVLRVIKTAWPDDPNARVQQVVRGIDRFLAEYQNEVDDHELAQRLSRYTPDTLLRETHAVTEAFGGNAAVNFARVILKAWNHRRRMENRLEDRFGRGEETR